MAELPNEKKLDQIHSQTNNKKSWLFTHIADTILDTKIAVKNGTKGQTTTPRTELAWNNDNFRGLRTLSAENAAVQKNLVAAIAALAKGEKFDEAKLLAGVQAAAQAGVKAAIDSIETTTTVNMKEA